MVVRERSLYTGGGANPKILCTQNLSLFRQPRTTFKSPLKIHALNMFNIYMYWERNPLKERSLFTAGGGRCKSENCVPHYVFAHPLGSCALKFCPPLTINLNTLTCKFIRRLVVYRERSLIISWGGQQIRGGNRTFWGIYRMGRGTDFFRQSDGGN